MSISDQEKQSLVKLADETRQYAYAPYSGYTVGAALRTRGGKVFTGVNVENAAYPAGLCAERTAVFKAVSEGEKEFEMLAVVTDNGATPCGSCRQVLSEFGVDTIVVIANASRRILNETTVAGLLPDAFLPAQLTKK